MSLQVYINDERLELKPNVGIGLTFQVGSILNPSARSGNLSNSFKVSKTQNNTRILGNLLNVNSNTNIPYQRNTAKVVQNGVEIFPDGFAVVEGLAKEYSVTVYSGNVSFFDLIKGRNINALPFVGTKMLMTEMTNTFNGTDDYIYPIVDYGLGTDLLDNTDTQNIDALFPLLFVKSIFDKILASVGYTLQGTFKDTDIYSRLLLGINKFGYTKEVSAATSGQVTTPVVINQNVNGSLSPGVSTTFDIDYTNNNSWSVFDLVLDEYKPDNTFEGTFQLECVGTLENLSPSGGIDVRVFGEVYEDGVLILSDNTNLIEPPNLSTLPYNVGLFFTGITAFKNKEYTAKVRVRVTNTVGVSNPSCNFTLDTSYFRFTATENIRFTADILPATFYNFDQDKLIKNIANMYSLIIQTDNTRKILYLNPLNDVKANIGTAKDWSNIIDLSKTVSVNYKLGNYAQENNLNYKEDDDVIGEFANGSILVNDTTLADSIDLMTLDFVAAESGSRVVNQHTPTIPIQTSVGVAFDKKSPRILLLDSKDTTVNFTSTVNGDTITKNTNIPFCYFSNSNKLDNLDFPSLIDSNYSGLESMLDKAKFVSAYFLLKEIDIANLDFTTPIFLDVHTPEINISDYFYINKISNFKENSSTKVDLIRI